MQKKESISNTSYYSFGQIQDTTKKCAPTAKCQFLDSHSSTQPNSIHLSHLNREKNIKSVSINTKGVIKMRKHGLLRARNAWNIDYGCQTFVW